MRHFYSSSGSADVGSRTGIYAWARIPILGVFLPLFFLISLGGLLPSSVQAQVVLNNCGPQPTQNFDVLPNVNDCVANFAWTDNTTITGWYIASGGTLRRRVSDGTCATGAIFSMGTDGSPDRALGSIASATATPNYIGARFQNNTGGTITNIAISYRGEQWRRGANSNTLTFEFSTDATSLTTGTWTNVASLNFTSIQNGVAAALDGNVVFTNINGNFAVTIANGAEFWIRWVDVDDAGADAGLAIDDFVIDVTGTVDAPTINPPVTPVCQNQVETYSVIDLGHNYDWTITPAGPVFTTPTNQPTVDIDFSGAAPGSYTLTATATPTNGCNPNSANVTIDVDPSPLSGTAGTDQTVCINTSATVNLVGYTGTIQWQEDPACTGTFTDIPGATSDTYNTPNLSPAGAYCYRAVTTLGNCTSISNIVTITVEQLPLPGTPSVNPTLICFGQAVDLDITGHTGNVQWQEQFDCAGMFFDIPGATTPAYRTAGLTGTSRCFRAALTNVCGTVFSGTVRVDIAPVTVGGTATATPNPVCEFDNITLQLNGQVGNHQWQEDIGCTGFYTNIGNVNDNPLIHTPPFSGLICYRAEVTSAPCPSAFSSVVQVDVDPFPIVGFAVEGNSFSTATTVCEGSNANLLIFGNNGQIQWQEDPGCAGNYTDIPGGTNFSFNVTVNALTCYRAEITSGVCQPLVSNIITIDTDPQTNPGTITALDNPVCTGDNYTLIGNGIVGDFFWEEDLGCTGTFNILPASFNINPLVVNFAQQGNNCYRILAFSGVCPLDVSVPFTITVNDPPVAGVAGTDQTVCQNASATLTLAGHTGDIQWEEDPLCTGGFTGIIGATQANYTTPALSQTTCYRAQVSTPGCPFVATNTVTISVDQTAIAGTATADQTICENQGAVLVLTGSQGNIQWQQDNGCVGNYVDIPGANSANYTTASLTAGAYCFRASVSSGTCPPVLSNSITAIVNAPALAGTASANQTLCFGSGATVNLAGHNGTIQWQEDPLCTGTFNNIPGATNTSYTSPALTQNTCYRAQVSVTGCPTVTSNAVTITIDPASVAGTATATPASPLCEGTPTDLSLAGHTGTIQWQEDPGCTGTYNNIGVLNANPLTVTPNVGNTCYRAQVTSGTCPSVFTATLNILVRPLPVGGTATADQTLCEGSSTTLNLAGSVGTIQWQQQVNCAGGFANMVGQNGTSLVTGPLTGTSMCYRARLTSAPCAAVFSNTVRIDLSPATVAGTATATPNPVCEFDNITLTLNGQTGSHQWQEDVGCTGFYSNIGNPNDNPLIHTPPSFGLMCYRAVVTSGACPSANTNIVQIDVDPFPNVGFAVEGISFSTATTVCEGSNANLLLLGNNGQLQWQEDPGCTGNYTDIPGGNTFSFNVTVNALTCYRAQVTSGVCQPLVSNIITIDTDPQTNPGTITALNNPVCTGDNYTLTGNGIVGDFFWEEDLGCTGTFTLLGFSFNMNPLVINNAQPGNNCYRIFAFSGVCPADISAPFTITVNDPAVAGTASANQTLCFGSGATVDLTGSSGNIQWEEDPLCTGNFTAIPGATNPSYTSGPLTQTTCYRAMVSTPGCPVLFSNTVTITIDPASVAGTPNFSSNLICQGQTVDLTLTGQVGNFQWQEDPGCINNWTNIGGINASPLTVTPNVGQHCYRAVVTSGTCPPVMTGVITITTGATPVAGTAGFSTTLCSGNAAVVVLNGSSGDIQWEEDPLCTGAFAVIPGATNPSYTSGPLTQTTCYRAQVSSPGCVTLTSNTVRIDIDPASVAGTPNANPAGPLCLGQTTDLTLAGHTGNIQWQEDPGCTGTYNNIGFVNANPLIVTPGLGNTCYRAQVTSGQCSPVLTSILTVTVNNAPVTGTANSDQTVCFGSGATINLVGSSGNIQWQSDIGCAGTFTDMMGETNPTLNVGPLAGTFCYRAQVSSPGCATVTSNTVRVDVDPASVAGTPNFSSNLICQGQTVDLTLTGQVGNFQWQEDPGCVNNWTNVGPINSSPLTVTPNVGLHCYRAVVTSGVCPPVMTGVMTITTGIQTVAGTVNADQTICINNAANLTLTGSQGNIQWQEDPGCAGTFTNIPGATNTTYNTGALTMTTCYRTQVSSPGCPTLTSNTVTVTVDPASVAGTATISANNICEGTTVDLTLTGSTGTIQWQEQVNCSGAFNNIGTPNSNPLTVTPVVGNTCYRATVTSGACPMVISNVVSVLTTTNTVAGTVTADQTICTGNAANLAVNGSSGNIQWQRQVNCTGAFTNIPGATNTTYNTGALTQTTCYRVEVSSANCPTLTSNVVTVTVSPASVAGTPSATPTLLCEGQTTDLSLAGSVGDIQWQQQPGCAGAYSDVGALNSNPLTLSPLVGTTCYRAVVTSGGCPPVITSVVAVTVNAQPVAGTASADQTICTGSAANITLAGHTGNIQWQRDVNCTGTFTNIGFTTPSFNTGALTQTTCYRAEVTNPGCGVVTSNTVRITVDAQPVAGTASTTTPNVCLGGNATLTVTGNTGDIQWQEDPNCTGFYTNVGNLNDNPIIVGPINVITCYRAQITNGTCPPVTTNIVQINTNLPPTVGTAGEFFTRQTNVIVCNGSSSSVSVDAFSGNIQWQEDPGCTGTFTDIAGPNGTLNPYDIPAVNGTICFRARVSRGVCPDVISNVVTYSTYPNPVPGTATVNVTNVCAGGTIDLSISGHTGTPQWQEDPGCTGSYTNISGLGVINFTHTVNTSACYRAIVFSGTCPPVFTNILNVTADVQPVAGTANSDQTICTGGTADLNVTGFTGSLQWQEDPGCVNNFTNIPGQTNPTYTTPTLTQNTCYRVRVSNGSCPAVFTNTVTITVLNTLAAGTASADQTLCFGSSATVNLVGNTPGTSIQWEIQDGCAGAFVDIPGETNPTANTGGLINTSCVRARVSRAGCPDAFSNIVTITITPVSQFGTVTVNPIQVCEGGVVQVTITGQVGDHQWQEDPQCTGTWSNIGTLNANPLVTGPLSVFTCYRAIVTSGVCPPETTNVDQVLVDPMTNPGFAFDQPTGLTNTTVCLNSTITMTVVGTVGDIQWQEQPGCTGPYTDIPGAIGFLYVHPQITQQTCFRAMVQSGVCTSIPSNPIQYNVDPETVAGTINAVPNPVCAGGTTVLTITGQTGQFFWEEDPGCTGTFAPFGVLNQNPITSNPINVSTCFRATVQSGVCFALQTDIIQVDPSTPPVTGVASANPTVVCTGEGTTLDLVGYTGNVQWQQDPTCTGTYTDIPGGITVPFTTSGLAGTTCFRAMISTLGCPAVYSNIVMVTVTPAAVAGTPNYSNSIVCNGSSIDLTLTGHTGDIQWEWDDNCDASGYVPVGPLNANPYTFVPPLGLHCYRASVTSGTCLPPAVTGPMQIQVNPQTVSGTASADQTVCSGQTANLTLAGHTGNIQWQSSTDCVTFTDIAGETNPTLTTPANPVTTCYRAAVTSPGCVTLNSNTVTITATPPSVAGTPSATPTLLCEGQTTSLSLTGHTGVIQWQQSFGCTGSYTNIGALDDNPHIATPAVGQTCYRAQVTSGTCPPTVTGDVIVNTSASPVPGTAAADQTICRGSSANLTLTGHVGTIQWQSQVNCLGVFNNVPGANSANYTTPALVVTTCYRAEVSNPGCTPVQSNVVRVQVDQVSVAGTPNFSTNQVCFGNTTTLTLAGQTGTIQWQEDQDCQGNFTDIGPVNANPFVVAPTFIGNTCYRARVTSGVCPPAFTGVMTITTYPQPVAGTALSDQTICSGQTATINLINSVGTVQWQNQINCIGVFNNIPGQTNVTLLTPALLTTTCYRAVVTNPGCTSVNSNTVRITVSPPTVAGTISVNNTTVCQGATVSLSIAGKTGNHQFEEDPGCLNLFTPIGAQNANPLVINPPVGITCYRATVQSGACPPAVTNTLTVTVGATPVAGTANSDQTICTGSSATVDLVGSTGDIQWQEQVNCAGAFTNNAFTTPSFNTGTLTQTMCYRAQVSSPGCATVTSNTVRITVSPLTVAGTPNHTGNLLCEGQTTNLTLTGQTGTFQWQQATDCVTYTNVGPPNASPLVVTPPVGVTCYRAVVTSGACPPQFTGVISVTVGATPIAGNITGTNAVCTGGATNLTLNGHTGNIQWQRDIGCTGTFTDIAGETNPTHNSGALTQNTCYRVTVSTPGCTPVQTAVFTVTVSPVSVPGTVTANATTICQNTPVTLTLTGSTGNIQWQEQVNCTGAFANVGVMNTNPLVTGPLTQTMCYRAVVTSGVCPAEITNVERVQVDLPTLAGTITPDQTICAASGVTLTLTGSQGNIQWQSSTDCVTYADITGETNPTLNTGALNVTTCFRAVLTSGVCPQSISPVSRVTVNPISDAGTATASATSVCSGDNVTITLAGHTGTIQWQQQANCTGAWTNTGAPNVNPLTVIGFNARTCYRAQVTSGVCPTDVSNEVELVVAPPTVAGTPAALPPNVCQGNPTNLELTGSVGSIQWEEQPNCTGAFTPIPGAIVANYQTGPINQLTCFRAVVQSGTCPAQTTTTVQVTIDTPTNPGTLASSQNVCQNNHSTVLTLTGYNGNILRWESSNDNFVTNTVNLGNAGNDTYTAVNNPVTTWYRVVVDNGDCPEQISNIIQLTVDIPPIAGNASIDPGAYCASGDAVLTLVGSSGLIQWQSTTNCLDANSFADIPGRTNANETIPGVNTTTCYRARVSRGTCPDVFSNVVQLVVFQNNTGGTLTPLNSTVCPGNTQTLTLTGYTGTIEEWQISNDPGFTIATNIPGTGAVNTTPILTQTSYVRVRVRNGLCAPTFSAVAEIVVPNPPVPGNITPVDPIICTGDNVTFNLAGQTGTVVQWETSQDNFTLVITTITTNATSQTFNNVTNNFCVRALVQTDPSCPGLYTNISCITVTPQTIAGNVTVDINPICPNEVATFTIAGHLGNVQWQQDPTCTGNYTDIPGQTGVTYITPPLTADVCIRARVRSGTCPPVFTNEITETVTNLSVGGTVSADATVCGALNNSTLLTLTGQNGTVLEWQISNDPLFVPFIVAQAGPQTTFTLNNIVQTTYVRAVVKNGPCPAVFSSVARVTADPASVGGTLTADASSVCAGNNTVNFTLAGNIGAVVRWEKSIDGGATWSTIINVTNNHTENNNNLTYVIRAVVRSGICPEVNSNPVTITVQPQSQGGLLSAHPPICRGATFANITLVGQVGQVLRWESSNDGFVNNVNAIPNVTATLNGFVLLETTCFRAVVQNGVCPAVFSAQSCVQVDQPPVAGFLDAPATVCTGGNTGNLTLTGFSGVIQRWESSTDNFNTVNTISVVTNTFTWANLTQSTCFRVVVGRGVCNNANSNNVCIQVDPASQPGIITGGTTVCAPINTTTLEVTGLTGNVVRWEWSEDNFNSVNTINSQGTQIIETDLIRTRCYRVVVKSGVCPEVTSNNACIVVVTPAPNPVITGNPATACVNAPVTLNSNNPLPGVGVWSCVGPNCATALIGNPNAINTTVTFTAPGNYVIRRTHSGPQAPCPPSDVTVQILVVDQPSVSNAGPDQTLCSTSAQLAANTPTVGTGQWIVVSGTATVTNPADPNSTVTGLSPGPNVFRWRITNPPCVLPSDDDVTINRSVEPLPANAGPDVDVCNQTTASITAGPIGAGVGIWSFESGNPSATIVTNGLRGDIVGMNTPGQYCFRWTVSNPPCTPVFDIACVNMIVPPAQPTTLTGPITLCQNATGRYTTTPVPGETYEYTTVPPGPVVTPQNNNLEADIQFPTAGQFVVVVTPRNPCGAGPNRTLIVTVNPIVTPNAGLDRTVCGASTTLIGSPNGGAWSCTNCPVQVTIQNAGPFGIVNNMPPNTPLTFRYTVPNNNCGTSFDDVVITNDLAVPGIVTTNTGSVCAGTAVTFNLTGQNGNVVRWESSTDGGVSWTIVPNSQGQTSITITPTATTNVRAFVNQTGVCPAVATASSIVFVAPSATATVTPANFTTCNSSITLAGNSLPEGATGVWTQVSGPTATINTSGETGQVSGMNQPGVYVFRWTVTNPPCPVTTADATITKIDAPVANAGPQQNICGNQTTATLTGNVPGAGTASWSQVSGPPATITQLPPNQANVTNLNVPGTYVFRYTISNPPCAPTTSDVSIVKYDVPAPDAGPDQTICGTIAQLRGNDPAPNATGNWKFVSGPTNGNPLVQNFNGYFANVTNLNVPGQYTFVYEIIHPQCGTLTDQMILTVLDNSGTAQVVQPNVGVCGVSDAIIQAVPPQNGTGTWSFISGPPNAPAVAIQTVGVQGNISGMTEVGDYRFRWTVVSACGTTTADVVVTRQNPAVAFAGQDQSVCNSPHALVMGNPVPNGCTGRWKFISGPFTADITTIGVYGSIVNMNVPGIYTFEWSFDCPNSVCPPASSVIRITRVEPPTIATAGPNQTICGNTALLNGNVPTVGTPLWSFVSGSPVPSITGANTPSATVSGLVSGTYRFRYTISNPPCQPSVSDVTITVNSPTVAGLVSGGGGPLCEGSNSGTLTLSGTEGTIVRWESAPDANFSNINIIANNTSLQSFNDLTETTCYRAVVKSGICPEATSNVSCVTIAKKPTIADAGPDRQICADNITIDGNVPVVGTASWRLVAGSPSPTLVTVGNGRTAVITNIQPGTYVYEYKIENAPCAPTTDQVVITATGGSQAGTVAPSRTFCSPTNSGVLVLSGHSGTIVRWESASDVNFAPATPITVTTNTYLFNNVTQTTCYRAIVKSGTCPETPSVPACVTITERVIANAGPDQQICGNSFVLTGNDPAPGVGDWRLVSGPAPAPTIVVTGRTANVSNVVTSGNYIFEYKITNGSCTPSTDLVVVNVATGSVAGVVNANQTICSGQSGTLVVTGNVGGVVRWESSTQNWQPGSINVHNNPTTQFTYTNLTQTTQFRAVIKNGPCPEATTPHVTVVVNQPPTIANAGSNVTVCGTTATLTGNIPVHGTGTWTFVTSDNGQIPTVTQSVNQAFITNMDRPGNYIFQYEIANPPCASSKATVAVTVVQAAVAGNINGPATVCSGTNSTDLTLVGFTGSIVRWESADDQAFTNNVTTIANTNSIIQVQNLTSSKYIRAVVQVAGCSSVNSQPVLITVSQPTVGGILSANQTVCRGSNAGTLTLTGHIGTVVNWEQSTDDFTYTTFSNGQTIFDFANLTQTTYFRVNVKNGPCAAAKSSTVKITVVDVPVAGTVGPNQTFCSLTNSGTLTLTGHQGNVIRWERSTDNINWTSIANITANQNFANITTTTFFRAIVQTGGCPEAPSQAAQITIDLNQTAGTLASNQTVCAGTNVANFTLTGHSGAVVRWEVSNDNFTTNTATPTNATTFQLTNLTQNTQVRVITLSGGCTLTSNTAVVTVVPASVGGTVASSAQTVCAPTNSGTLTLTGNTGTVVRWESTTDPAFVSGITSTPSNLSTYTFTNLTQTTYFRAVVQNAPCSEATSTQVAVTVTPASVGGSIAGAVGSCGGSASGTMTLTGHVGTVIRWESSTNAGFSPVSTTVTNATTLAYNNVTQTTYYRAVVQSGNCATANSATAIVEITAPPVAGTLTSNGTVCNGVNSGVLNLIGLSGTVIQWESANNVGFTGATVVTTTATTFTYNNLTQTTFYRVRVGSGVCPPVYSNTVQITVLAPLTLTATPVVGCSGAGSIQASATGGSGSPYTYSITPAVAPNNTNGQFNNIPQGTYTVRVQDNFGCFTTQTVTIGNTPTPPTITSVTSITTTSAVVAWANMGTGVVYTFRYRVLGAPTWTVVSNLTSTTIFLSSLQNNTTYEIEVSYKCPNNGPQSGFSTGVIRQFTTLSQGACNLEITNQPIPGGIYLDNITNNSAVVHWNHVQGAAGYIISYGPITQNPNAWTQVIVCEPTHSYTIPNLNPNTNYGVRVRTNCSNCISALNNSDKRSPFSSIFNFTTLQTRADDALASGSELSIYPNPNKGNFTINFNADEEQTVNLRLFDMTGKLILARSADAVSGENQIPVEMTGYASGVYLLQVERGGRVQTIKVIVE